MPSANKPSPRRTRSSSRITARPKETAKAAGKRACSTVGDSDTQSSKKPKNTIIDSHEHITGATASQSQSIGINDIPECLLGNIMDFVGDHEYVFVAGVNQQFRRLYEERFDTFTSFQASVTSISRAKMISKQGIDIWNERACEYAALVGKLDVLKWARKHGCHWTSSTCSRAATNGHLNVLRWAFWNGCEWDRYISAYVAFSGHFDVLKWIKRNVPDWNSPYICMSAAEGGHLEILKWARSNDCAWGVWTCENAAMHGHLDVLVWARTNGCEWNIGVCKHAAYAGHLDVLKWARDNGCEWNSEIIDLAAGNEHWEVVKWAAANGCPWSRQHIDREGVLLRISGWPVDVRDWLHENGYV